ncbi:hypothetical protein [Rhodococcus sp. T7]|uniref:hypothetical protein n=1 Tax=Rhodococcus sp. T7 TaxID=627444 RepID=UPI001357FEBD|nr:hypothetical protein [Rhodococcus sp. T7]KAF0957844.1 hypothetical protein MLGJGCBP_09676 [Rhodococcus sp. T7]KAF0961503.1 hypothetical protein MLGJGCBP_05383 [Rhodococcus sp. T7]
MDTTEVPEDIAKIAGYLARSAKMSGGSMKWNEEAKLKASLTNERARWSRARVSPELFEAQCQAAGLPADDVVKVGEFLRKTQSGKRLVPHRSYRDWTFRYDYDAVV